jgi:hypothetical protein
MSNPIQVEPKLASVSKSDVLSRGEWVQEGEDLPFFKYLQWAFFGLPNGTFIDDSNPAVGFAIDETVAKSWNCEPGSMEWVDKAITYSIHRLRERTPLEWRISVIPIMHKDWKLAKEASEGDAEASMKRFYQAWPCLDPRYVMAVSEQTIHRGVSLSLFGLNAMIDAQETLLTGLEMHLSEQESWAKDKRVPEHLHKAMKVVLREEFLDITKFVKTWESVALDAGVLDPQDHAETIADLKDMQARVEVNITRLRASYAKMTGAN